MMPIAPSSASPLQTMRGSGTVATTGPAAATGPKLRLSRAMPVPFPKADPVVGTPAGGGEIERRGMNARRIERPRFSADVVECLAVEQLAIDVKRAEGCVLAGNAVGIRRDRNVGGDARRGRARDEGERNGIGVREQPVRGHATDAVGRAGAAPPISTTATNGDDELKSTPSESY